MKTSELIKKLGSKLLGKQWKPAAVQLPPEEKSPDILVMDRLGVIQLHEYWRN
jgi:hypothetical protein